MADQARLSGSVGRSVPLARGIITQGRNLVAREPDREMFSTTLQATSGAASTRSRQTDDQVMVSTPCVAQVSS